MGKVNVTVSIENDMESIINKWREEDVNAKLKRKSRILILFNSFNNENVSIAASSGCIAGLIYGSAYFGCVETGLLGLLMGGGIGYVLDRVLPVNRSSNEKKM